MSYYCFCIKATLRFSLPGNVREKFQLPILFSSINRFMRSMWPTWHHPVFVRSTPCKKICANKSISTKQRTPHDTQICAKKHQQMIKCRALPNPRRPCNQIHGRVCLQSSALQGKQCFRVASAKKNCQGIPLGGSAATQENTEILNRPLNLRETPRWKWECLLWIVVIYK